MSSLQPGQSYKLSLLFHEQCCSRGFDIFVGGAAVVEAYSPQVEQGGVSEAGRPGALVTYSFAAQSAQLAVELQSTPDDEVSTAAGQRLSSPGCVSHTDGALLLGVRRRQPHPQRALAGGLRPERLLATPSGSATRWVLNDGNMRLQDVHS